MKNLLLGMVCLALLSCGGGNKQVDNSQDQTEEADLGGGRKNRAKGSFNTQSEIITKATRWVYSESDGEWFSSENGLGSRDFISMQFKTLVLDSTTYYVLMIEKEEAEFKDPSDEESIYVWKEMYGYIFTEEEYNKLNTTSDSVIELKTRYTISTKSERYDDNTFVYDIKRELEDGLLEGMEEGELNEDIEDVLRDHYSPIYTFPVQKITVEGEKLVRFYVPTDFSEKSGNINYDFETEYFEVTPTAFNKLLIQ